MKRRRWTANARKAFLATLAGTGNVTRACEAAGLGRSRAYALREEDEAFRAGWEEAEEAACDALEAEARSLSASCGRNWSGSPMTTH